MLINVYISYVMGKRFKFNLFVFIYVENVLIFLNIFFSVKTLKSLMLALCLLKVDEM